MASFLDALKVGLDFYFEAKKGTVWEFSNYIPNDMDGGLNGIFESYDFDPTPARFTQVVRQYKQALIDLLPARIRLATANWKLIQALAARIGTESDIDPWSPNETEYETMKCAESDQKQYTEGFNHHYVERMHVVLPNECSHCYYFNIRACFPDLLAAAGAVPLFFHCIYEAEEYEQFVLGYCIRDAKYDLVENLQVTAAELERLRHPNAEVKEGDDTPLVTAILGVRKALLESEDEIKHVQDTETMMSQVAREVIAEAAEEADGEGDEGDGDEAEAAAPEAAAPQQAGAGTNQA